MSPRQLDSAGMQRLADALGDSPLTVISCHYLRGGQCRAWTAGPVEAFEAAVVQWDELPGEPEGYGQPGAIWRILRDVPGWKCVDVAPAAADAVAALIAKETGVPCTLYGDLYHVLRQPVRMFSHPDVRLFGPNDVDFVRRALPEELGKPDKFARTVAWGIHAAAVADGRIVAYAYTSARTGGQANIGVETCAAHRNRGYCSAAASLVAHAVQQAGEIPVWSAGESNAPSLRVAAKLGFELIGRKTYVGRRLQHYGFPGNPAV